MVNLTTLAPDIVAADLDETLAPEVTLSDLAVGPPAMWEGQWRRLASPTSSDALANTVISPVLFTLRFPLIGSIKPCARKPLHVASW